MAKLPVISGQECVKALQRAGFEVRSQKGSHVKLRRGERTVIVNLASTLDRGTLRGILSQAGLTAEDLKDLL